MAAGRGDRQDIDVTDVDLAPFLESVNELLTVRSTADRPDELHRALEFVTDFVGGEFGSRELVVERFESHGKPSALIYRADGRTDPAAGGRADGRPEFRVILNAHLDVVPAEPAQFVPRRTGDRLYARGAHDMKVTGLMQADVFRRLAGTLPYPLGLQLVTDEEVGGRDGTLHQLEHGITGRFVVIGEQSRLEIVTESKGLIRAKLRAAGRSAHSAYPWLGDNALMKLSRSIDAVLARYPVPDGEQWRTTVNVARIDTSNQVFNQVPDDAEAWLDIRFPADDVDLNGRTAAEVAGYLGTFCRPGVAVEVDRVDGPHRADPDRPEVRQLQRAAQSQGFPAGFLRKHGAGDGRFYSQRGIAAVSFGIGGAGQHGPDEYADITTIGPYRRALTSFLRSLDG
jgi:succinyl-diaminopimelate desuccinylase